MKVSYLMILTSTIVGFSACKKEGCTDKTATNYSEKAKKDDGSCKFTTPEPTVVDYNSSSIFWFDSDAAINFAGELYTTLYLYVDNVKVDSTQIDNYTDSEPSCGALTGINYNQNLGTVTTKNIAYSIKSKDLNSVEQTLVTGNATLNGGSCAKVKIVY